MKQQGFPNQKIQTAGLQDSLGIAMIASTAQAVDYKTTFGVNNLTITL